MERTSAEAKFDESASIEIGLLPSPEQGLHVAGHRPGGLAVRHGQAGGAARLTPAVLSLIRETDAAREKGRQTQRRVERRQRESLPVLGDKFP
jgi:hypothetical protein